MPLKILPSLPSDIANRFRRIYVKGFVIPGPCNYYIGLTLGDLLIGVLGFSNPDYGNYSIMLKADTTPSALDYSTDLLLYILRTRYVKKLLEKKFNREMNTAYSMCFSSHKTISRYRKHGEKIQEKKVQGGYNLGYSFKLGTVPTKKAAISMWKQKHKI
jgi:hypothetical protein